MLKQDLIQLKVIPPSELHKGTHRNWVSHIHHTGVIYLIPLTCYSFKDGL